MLSVKNLKLYLQARKGDLVQVVGGVDLRVNSGETVGLIGETGAGKTVTARSIMGILQPLGEGEQLWKIEGEVLYKGRDLLKLSKEEFRDLRGNEISMIFQNPVPSLHPTDIVGYQTGETVEAHEDLEILAKKKEIERIKKMVFDYLGKVEIADAEKRYYSFRDEFSGGEAQRILIAMALIANPSLLIADEPTSSLDVTVQRQVLELLKAVKKEFGLSMLMITHNLAVIAEMSDYVYVMYAGKIMEHGDVYSIFKKPKHPYTRGLMSAIPRIDADYFEFGGVPGEPPTPPYNIPGCIFHPRCKKYAKPICSEKEPPMSEFEPRHFVACHRVYEI
ncbi:MAG: ABC transporter ATP-binding protein [Candidatus Bathyarchaeota archaeon]|nr:ABC transporter ATP-binding protein [Candidatus Bathyarchaeota archaeon]